ncbi:unnamed protein product [Effrenium voratum]|uniref:Uncharacterized protein n=1 Tax=Effrenium voratum TaxID=2562239 RepID=A0AA36IMI5_9DINO|nr:unnamed protein product [Effrenium voratum]
MDRIWISPEGQQFRSRKAAVQNGFKVVVVVLVVALVLVLVLVLAALVAARRSAVPSFLNGIVQDQRRLGFGYFENFLTDLAGLGFGADGWVVRLPFLLVRQTVGGYQVLPTGHLRRWFRRSQVLLTGHLLHLQLEISQVLLLGHLRRWFRRSQVLETGHLRRWFRTVRRSQVLLLGHLRRWFRTVFRLHLKLVALTAQDGEEKPSSRDGAAAPVVKDSEKKLSLHYGAPQDCAGEQDEALARTPGKRLLEPQSSPEKSAQPCWERRLRLKTKVELTVPPELLKEIRDAEEWFGHGEQGNPLGKSYGREGLTLEQRNWLKKKVTQERWSVLAPEKKQWQARGKPESLPLNCQILKAQHSQKIIDILEGFASAQDAATVLARSVAELQKWPNFADAVRAQMPAAPAPDDCSQRERLLTGLAATPGFEVNTPAGPCRQARDHIDRVVRDTFEDRDKVLRLGYRCGKARWSNASAEPGEAVLKRGGRPSKVNDPALVAAARAKFSQESSQICKDVSGDWTVSRTSTRMANTIFESTVLPMMQKIMGEQRQQLETMMPEYFAAWDTYAAVRDIADRPAVVLQELEHYISRHVEKHPCRKHRGTDFPCGQHALRARGGSFPQRRRVELHGLEAACGLELRSVLKLVLSYNHHKAANEHQSPVLRELQIAPPEKTLSVLSDWKELISLPISHCASGEQFYATARMEISAWGACVADHRAGQPVSLTYCLVISNILDHTCLRTNQLLDMVLSRQRGEPSVDRVALISDPGPHYRAYESLFTTTASLWCVRGNAKCRSYCFSSKLDTREKPTPLGVRIFNHVFSSMPVSVEIDDFVVEDCELPADWILFYFQLVHRFELVILVCVDLTSKERVVKFEASPKATPKPLGLENEEPRFVFPDSQAATLTGPVPSPGQDRASETLARPASPEDASQDPEGERLRLALARLEEAQEALAAERVARSSAEAEAKKAEKELRVLRRRHQESSLEVKLRRRREDAELLRNAWQAWGDLKMQAKENEKPEADSQRYELEAEKAFVQTYLTIRVGSPAPAFAQKQEMANSFHSQRSRTLHWDELGYEMQDVRSWKSRGLRARGIPAVSLPQQCERH